jgi:hypothetical protein
LGVQEISEVLKEIEKSAAKETWRLKREYNYTIWNTLPEGNSTLFRIP